MKNLTIRNISPELAEALEKEKRQQITSLKQTVLDLMSQTLGVGNLGERINGLSRLAGTWTREEHEQFELAIVTTEQIDEELWR